MFKKVSNEPRSGFLLLTILILLLTGCSAALQSFNDKALSFATNDDNINKKEYESLMKLVAESDDKGLLQLKDEKGNIDHTKIKAYLVKLFTAKKLTLTEKDIWQPASSSLPEQTFNVNVYLENSASMDGYVNGITEFETAIYNLLGDFKISGACDSLNLSYINNGIPYQKKNALSSDIQDFIEKLEPATFRQRGGNRSVSDLKNILSSVLNTVNDKNAAVVISDFVFSPGKNVAAQDYLNNQGVGIKIDFAQKIKDFDLSAIVIQLQSDFDGLYYDQTGKPLSYKGKRPYYIWILGSAQQISSILDKKILDNIKGSCANRLVLHTAKATNIPDFKIQYSSKIGNFSAAALNDKIISEATASKEPHSKGKFGFNVAVDFSKSLQDVNYFLDTANYTLSNPGYHLKVEPILDKNNPSLSGFTHLLKLQTGVLKSEVLKIDVVGKTPTWVYTSSSDDDSDILTDVSEQQKTFGLKYLIGGAIDAFYPNSATHTVNTIHITIKK